MGLKLLSWIGSSKKDLKKLPRDVQKDIGAALLTVQWGDKPENAKPFKGFGDAQVLEIIEEDQAGTYRAVYTVRLEDAIYVLHVFNKKSKSGIATPKKEMELVESRLRMAYEISKSKQKGHL
jgi:phage-related protein